MAKVKPTQNVDVYLAKGCGRCELAGTPECKVLSWQRELMLLRNIALSLDLKEEVKWGVPCYTLNGKNIFLIHSFKNYCAVLFMKGVLMKDPDGILIQQTEQVQSGRQIRFENDKGILAQIDLIRKYMLEAIRVEKSGKKMELKKTEDYPMPEELTEIFRNDPTFENAFKTLTPGRQRGYLLYFSGAKQASTRISRIMKYHPHILEGKGLQDSN